MEHYLFTDRKQKGTRALLVDLLLHFLKPKEISVFYKIPVKPLRIMTPLQAEEA